MQVQLRNHKAPEHCHLSSSRDGRNLEGSVGFSMLHAQFGWPNTRSRKSWYRNADREPTQPQSDKDVVSKATKHVRSFVLKRNFLPWAWPRAGLRDRSAWQFLKPLEQIAMCCPSGCRWLRWAQGFTGAVNMVFQQVGNNIRAEENQHNLEMLHWYAVYMIWHAVFRHNYSCWTQVTFDIRATLVKFNCEVRCPRHMKKQENHGMRSNNLHNGQVVEKSGTCNQSSTAMQCIEQKWY